jgi:hypothetical protein
MSVEIEGYRTIYKNPRYYCEPGPSIVCDEDAQVVVAFRQVLSWLDAGGYGALASGY